MSMVEHLRLNRGQAAQLCANSLQASFMTDERKALHLNQLKKAAI